MSDNTTTKDDKQKFDSEWFAFGWFVRFSNMQQKKKFIYVPRLYKVNVMEKHSISHIQVLNNTVKHGNIL